MGSSQPKQPKIKERDPVVYQSFIPPEDFDYAKELGEKYLAKSAELDKYLNATTQLEKEREARTAAAYLSSLPGKEPDYTAGLTRNVISNLNNPEFFNQDLKRGKKERRVGRYAGEVKDKANKYVDPVPEVRKVAEQFANKRYEEAYDQEPVSEPTTETSPYNEGKWGTKWGKGSYDTEELRKRFGLIYNEGLERRAAKRKGVGTTGLYNEKGDIWGKSSTGEDVYLGRVGDDSLYGNKELISGHRRQADSGEVIHEKEGSKLSSIGDRAGAIWNLWKRA